MREGLRDAWKRRVRRVLLQAPTGSGKTALASDIVCRAQQAGHSVFFNCHRDELVTGTSRTFTKYGIAHDFVSASRRTGSALVKIASVDTLKNRVRMLSPPKVAVWDEAHHLGAEGWRAIMKAWPNTYHVGLSATPWRLDGTGLGDCFDEMIEGPAVAWLIEQGYLANFEIFAPNVPDMSGVRKHGREYSRADASARMDIPKRTGDIITHWRRHALGRRTIGFGVNVGDSMMMAEAFRANGIGAVHLDGKTSDTTRRNAIRDYANGSVQILFNVALFDEGFDLASIAQRDDIVIEALIDAAPTQSLSRVMQRWGRALRPQDGDAIILDHAGNTLRHGFPDDPRAWSLDGREKSGKGGDDGPPPPVICTDCYMAVRRPLPPCCPHCGKSFAKVIAQHAIEAEGELKKLSKKEIEDRRAAMRLEEHQAKTYQELFTLARKRGYANPAQWALKRFANSASRQAHARRVSQEA